MKYCPQCQTTYSDELLKYCLKDGAPLGEVFGSPIQSAAFGGEQTAPPIRQVEPIRVPVEQNAPVQNQFAPQNNSPIESPVVTMRTGGGKSKTGSVVALTILGTLLFLGVGAFLYSRNQKTDAVASVNKSAENRPANTNSTIAQTSNPAASQSVNINANVILPTPKPKVDRQRREEAVAEVEGAVGDWKNATENLDIGGQLSQYAETVDYYRSGRVSRTRVRADKDRAFGIYNSVDIDISNLKITPGDSGENATALFDKEWNFKGDAGNSSGKVRQQLTFSRIAGKWLITGERDLKVYYLNN